MKTFEYALKTWQTSVLLSPVALAIHLCITRYETEPLGFIFTAIIMGIIYSFPSFIIFGFVCRWVAGRNRTVVQQKSLLSIVGIALTLLSFYLFCTGMFMRDAMIDHAGDILTYATTIVAGIWFYNFHPVTEDSVKDIGAA